MIPILGHLIGFATLLVYLLWPTGLIAHFGPIPVPEAMIWCAINGFFMVWWIAPSFAMLTLLAPTHIRSTAMALQMLLNTILGVGIGPLLVGMLSDIMHPALGVESLRYALILVATVVLFSTLTLAVARRHFLKTVS